jgi:hypothetical protein
MAAALLRMTQVFQVSRRLSRSAVTGSNYAFTLPGSHSLAHVPTAPVPAGGEGSAKAALHKTIDPLQPSSAIRMATPDPPPQSDVIAPGSSRRSLNTERTADHPLHPSHDQSNMV